MCVSVRDYRFAYGIDGVKQGHLLRTGSHVLIPTPQNSIVTLDLLSKPFDDEAHLVMASEGLAEPIRIRPPSSAGSNSTPTGPPRLIASRSETPAPTSESKVPSSSSTSVVTITCASATQTPNTQIPSHTTGLRHRIDRPDNIPLQPKLPAIDVKPPKTATPSSWPTCFRQDTYDQDPPAIRD